MRDPSRPRPGPAPSAVRLIEQSRCLIEHSRALREESRRLRAHFHKVCEQTGRVAGRLKLRP
jgi:hypothetical protein